mgnify:CR=1 FL=1
MSKLVRVDDETESLATKVIGAAIEVHRVFGPGFQEVTYHRALRIELEDTGISVQSEAPVELRYKKRSIGEGRIDMLVEQKLVVELKAAQGNSNAYRRQVATYLHASGLKLGLVINFENAVLRDGIARVLA